MASIYIDLTTAFAEQHRIPHGTTRVERKLVEALVRLQRSDVTFCRFDRALVDFVALSPEQALAATTATPVADVKREARTSTRNLPVIKQLHTAEVWFRRHVRDRLRKTRSETVRAVAPRQDIFAPGSVLLVPGELQRHDFASLMSLRRRLNIKLAFLFYDLLDTLSADDPRAQDPDAVDIPGSEFVAREAALILPISDFSAGELQKHATSRGLQLAPIRTIRLGHEIAEASAMTDVAGLSPGRFVLTVGDVTARKNHALLVGVWRTLARRRGAKLLPLVIAGRIGADGQPLYTEVQSDPDVAGVVKFLPSVDDAQLLWLYGNCRFTVFPSLSEGFGLPVVESLAFGKPCIASNATAIPEASQGMATHLDPHDAAAWQQTIERLLDDDQLLAENEQAITHGFRVTTWSETAAQVLREIDSIAAGAESSASQ